MSLLLHGDDRLRRLLFLALLLSLSLAWLLFNGGERARTSAQVKKPSGESGGDWKPQTIPDVWKRPPRGLYSADGFAWFRCLVNVPADWRETEVELFSEAVDDAREVFVNGVKVGVAGAFPPRYRSGLGEESSFRVPKKVVRFGELNVVAIRVFDFGGRRNFNVAAPVLFGGKGAVRMSGKWQWRTGDDQDWALWKAERPTSGEKVFTKVEDAAVVRRTLKKLTNDEGPLAPAEAAKRFKTPDDLEIKLVLADPVIGQPLSFNFDERGRLWLVEYLQYPNPAGLKMVSRDRYLRAVYDKVPPAPPNHFRGADRVTIHEDTNADGVYDKHKTFVAGLNIVSSAVKGRGGVWVLNPPYLLFYPDKDNDDAPDGDPVVHLEGFGLEDSHSVVNSLRFGPDGWLYAAQGSTVSAAVRRPGIDKKKDRVHSMGQLVWRYHPDTRRYEVFAEGGGNTFGVEIDAKGRIYSGTNGGDARGYHYVQGGYFRKGFNKHGPLSNPYAFGHFPHIAHHKVPRFTHDFIIYEGMALPEKYHGKLFGVGPLQSHVLYSDVRPQGSTFQTKDLGLAVSTSDTWFRPVAIKSGPDGAIYVADFYEQRIDHASHYQGRVHKKSGRIYRIAGRGTKPGRPFDYSKLSSRELVKLLAHPNRWHRQIALRLFADRKDHSAVPLLKKLIAEERGQTALEGLWAIHLSGGFDEELALQSLAHVDPHVRLWTVRLLCDDGEISRPVAEKLAHLARRETNVEVRSQLACSAKRLDAEYGLPIVRFLLGRDEDLNDPHMPQLLWWAVESKAAGDREAVLGLLRSRPPGKRPAWRLPLVREHLLPRIMRRYAAAGARKDLLTCAKLLNMAPTSDDAKRLMAGFEQAFAGRSLGNLPAPLVEAMAKAGGGSLALRLRLADTEAIEKALGIIADKKAKLGDRVRYVQVFGQINQDRCVAPLLKLVETSRHDELRSAAFTALQSYQKPAIAAAALRLHDSLPGDVREVAQTLLASRRSWALEFLAAVDSGRIDRKNIPPPVVRKLLFHDDKRIAALVNKHWGTIQGATTEEMRQRIKQYADLIAAGSGNPYQGKKLFGTSCGKCHVLFQQGGKIGPDLTAFKRDDLTAMLLHVVNPGAEIREGFENHLVITADGRALSGFIIDQDPNVVVLKGADGQSLALPRAEIDEMSAVPRSLMPEGILKPFTPQQVRDLFAYLRATQPLP